MDNSDMSFINPHRLTFSRQYLLSLIGVVTAICPSEVYFLKKEKKKLSHCFPKGPSTTDVIKKCKIISSTRYCKATVSYLNSNMVP